MIEEKTGAHGDILELRISGTVTERDYTEVLIPALEARIAEHKRVRLLVRFDSNVSDFTLGALFEDSRMGLKHWRGFDRVAVVAEPNWITKAIRAFAVIMPCPVMIFPLAEEDEARRWLSESLGAIHQTDLGDGALHLQLLGKLDSAVYEEEGRDLDAFIARNGRIRLLLDLREFDGWQGLGAIAEHLSLVREHRRAPERVAIVGRNTFTRLAEGVGRHFLDAEVRYFDAAAFEEAKAWIKGGAGKV
ncbi:SpoIIAA-like [Poseidonocella pacifica]|uniref:SpoIIAA-like n=1 Tax=Poseidonocella pacifica TaxID=871651 RepID=A0A1I0XI71_9RHOB|nr:STAS/SEC14 domain-containing protein [Poseidonocella pacifica]SFA99928.1 SpoIIAA-like [Poseidonocella pacifica]